ncbi:MAG TPA: oligosaccharide flippase family protein [Solirubrobacteraceae bacterium]|jgi:O-antigen/teichoic acid export membrane protein
MGAVPPPPPAAATASSALAEGEVAAAPDAESGLGAEVPGLAGSRDRNERSAMGDVSVIAGSTYVAQVFNFLAGLVQKGLLGPVGTGFWALMQSFWQLSKVAQLGVFDGTSRQVPIHRGRKDYAAAAAAADTGFSFSLLALAVLGVLLATFSLAFGAGWAPQMRWGLVLLGVTGPLRLLADAHMNLLQETRRFGAASAATVLQAAIGLTLQTALVAAFGFYGMFAGAVAASVGALWLYARMGLTGFRRPAFRLRIDWMRMRELIAYGFPFMAFGQIWLMFMGIDNLIVAGFIDVKSLGYYAMAVSVTDYILNLPRSIGQALFPRMAERFGETGEVNSFAHYAIDAQRLLAYMVVPVFVAGAYFLMPVLIRHVLPAYRPAIPVVHVMVAGSFVMALCNLPIKAMLTAGKRLALILIVGGCLGVNALANYLAVAVWHGGIEGAAVATVFSYFVVFVATSGYALDMMIGRRTTVAHIAELLVATGYVCGLLWLIEALVGAGAGALVPDALVGLLKLALFMVALTPCLVLAEKRVQGMSRLRDGLRKLVARLRGPRAAGA